MHPASNRHALATITAGRWKGRRLRYPRDGRVRPTMRRTKESLFSSLGAALEGCVFADLYAGAGAVGIEALSRGARHVHFVEVSRDAVDMLLENLAQCGADPVRFTVHQVRVADAVGARPCPLADATIVFADPPYDVDANLDLLADLSEEALPHLEILVLEHRAKQPVKLPAHLALDRERRFGDTMLSYLVPAAADDTTEEDA